MEYEIIFQFVSAGIDMIAMMLFSEHENMRTCEYGAFTGMVM